MSAADNEAIVRRYFSEAFEKANSDVIDELFDADYVNHGSIPGHPVQDREGVKRVEQATRKALPRHPVSA